MFIIASQMMAAEPFFHSEFTFPLLPRHVHSSCTIECPNGELPTRWFHGSGERESPDVVKADESRAFVEAEVLLEDLTAVTSEASKYSSFSDSGAN